MVKTIAILYIIPITLFYLAYIAKQKMYAIGGILGGLILSIPALMRTSLFDALRSHYFNETPNEIIFKYAMVVTVIVSVPFLVYVFLLEAKLKKKGEPVHMRNDVLKMLSSTKRNLFFWFLIISYYIVIKIFID